MILKFQTHDDLVIPYGLDIHLKGLIESFDYQGFLNTWFVRSQLAKQSEQTHQNAKLHFVFK
jgi:hypothetical protein